MRTLAAGISKAVHTLPASRGSLPPGGTTAPAVCGYSPRAGRFIYCAALFGGRYACGLMKLVSRPDLTLNSTNPTFFALRLAPDCRIRQAGFTLIELLIVVAIMAIATAGVGLALRDSSGTALEREAQRLAVLLDSARVQSRMTANPVRWRPTPSGFVFEGLTGGSTFPTTWLGQDVRVAGTAAVLLGPEPVIGPQQIRLMSISQPTRSLALATDGIRPFAVVTEGAP